MWKFSLSLPTSLSEYLVVILLLFCISSTDLIHNIACEVGRERTKRISSQKVHCSHSLWLSLQFKTEEGRSSSVSNFLAGSDYPFQLQVVKWCCCVHILGILWLWLHKESSNSLDFRESRAAFDHGNTGPSQVVGSYQCLSAHSMCIILILWARTAQYSGSNQGVRL